ncbi:hypothetical protein GCM10023168_26590 [Fodinibacter luteus]|uniref:Secreted protein n=1 Tax=Fodinibacter luteus TaxID=552064 RepID=A0ABP8KKT0_9MICO
MKGLNRVGGALRRLNAAGLTRVVLASGAAVGVVALAAAHPLDLDLVSASGDEDVSVVGSALATRVVQVCPGPELSGIPGVDDVEVPAALTAATGPEELLPLPATGEGALVAVAGKAKVLTVDTRPGAATAPLEGAAAVRLTGTGALAPAVAGTQEWRADGKDLRGLVTVPCAAGGSDLWLLGGGAGPGRQERLVLTNPGDNPVTTDVTVHGAAGPLGAPVVETVPPGGRVSLLLDARAAAETMPAVHVRADGGGIQATLTDTWIEGSTALGAETTAPIAQPATVQVVPAAVVGGGATTVRVAVPGEQDAVVRVTVLGGDGLVPASGDTVLTAAAGSVGELTLEGVPTGTYAVMLRSDVPVVGSVLSRVGDGSAPGEFAWSGAVDGVRSLAGAAVEPVADVDRSLHLVATGGNVTAEVVTVIDGTPRTRSVDLLSDRVAIVPLDVAESVWVRRTTGSGELRGTVLSSQGSGPERLLSSMPLQESVVTSAVSRAFPLP